MKIILCTLATLLLGHVLKAQALSSKSNAVSMDTLPANYGAGNRFRDRLLVGVEAGYDQNYLLTNISNLAFTTYKPLGGYVMGIPLEYKLNPWMSVSSDPNLSQKNYQLARTGFFQGVYENFTNSYIQLPIYAHFTFGESKVKGFLNLGGYSAYWKSSRVKGTEANILNPVDTAYSTSNPSSILGEQKGYSYREKYEFNKTRDRRFEFGWLLGIGLSYDLNRKYKFFLEGRLVQSLSDQQKKYMINQVPRYNQTYGLSMGCLVRLNGIANKNKAH